MTPHTYPPFPESGGPEKFRAITSSWVMAAPYGECRERARRGAAPLRRVQGLDDEPERKDARVAVEDHGSDVGGGRGGAG